MTLNERAAGVTIETQPFSTQFNPERLSSLNATYDDLIDMFARELSSDEILLISGGAAKGGSSYTSGSAYV